jgi:beta-lactamase regulating signal transducer with metallopeptidase domain/protein involved in polysaccharide export with SLBB domain
MSLPESLSLFAAVVAESLLHFLWQGAALGAIAYATLRRLHHLPRARYIVGVGFLATMAAMPVVTTWWLMASASVSVTAAGSATGTASTLPVAWILGVWAAGAIVCSSRVVGGWLVARRMTRASWTPVTDDIARVGTALMSRLRITRAVRILQSSAVTVPMMVGWLKPVVLLPTAAVMHLPPAQLEALLAHELAHVRRHDYLVNLLQSVVEALLFYHPAVWWLSRDIRDAREHCCDDLTVGVCDRLSYVTALAAVASTRVAAPAVAVSGGSLRRRIERLVRPTTPPVSTAGWLAVVVPAMFLLTAMLPLSAPTTSVPVQAPMQQFAMPQSAIEQPAIEQPAIEQSAIEQSAIEQSAIDQSTLPQLPIPQSAIEQSPILNPQSSILNVEATATPAPRLPLRLDFFVPTVQATGLTAPPERNQSQAQGRQVQAGDRIRLSFFNLVRVDDDMNGVYEVAPSGHIDVKHAGRLAVTGQTVSAVQDLVYHALVPRYYVAGVIDVTAAFEPSALQQASGAKEDFIVLGMVARPGSRSWTPGMTIERALELAGGLTSGLTLAAVVIERPVRDERGDVLRMETIKRLRPTTPVLAGDIVSARLRGPGDTVTVDVAELPSLSGQWVLQADGSLRRALEASKSEESGVQPDELHFAVNGEVNSPGMKVWKSGMTVLQAVALAGGMTSKGKYGHINRPVFDARGNVTKYEQIKTLKDDTPILAGDVLVIARKWFGG